MLHRMAKSIHRQCQLWEDYATSLGFSSSWPSGETPRLSKGKRVVACSIENSVPGGVAVTHQRVVPCIEFSSAKGNFDREKELEDTMLDLLAPFTDGLKEDVACPSTPNARGDPVHVIEEQLLEDKPPSVVTDARRDTLAKETKSEKRIIGSQQRGYQKAFTRYPKDPNCEVRKMTKTARARCRIKTWSQGSERGNRVKVRTQKCSDRAQGFSRVGFREIRWKTKDTSGTMSCLQRFLPLSLKPERVYTDNSKTMYWRMLKSTMESWHKHPLSIRNERRNRKCCPQSERRDRRRTSAKWTT